MEAFEQSAGRIAKAIGEAACKVAPGSPIMLGKIVQTQPLRLQASGLTIDHDSIRINEAMKAQAMRNGDQVVVLSPDGQIYYILCKVVSL